MLETRREEETELPDDSDAESEDAVSTDLDDAEDDVDCEWDEPNQMHRMKKKKTDWSEWL